MDVNELLGRFSAHNSENRFKDEALESMYEQFYIFSRQIDAMISDGREKSLAMTKLEEAMFWVKKSIDITSR
jgi:hypothetical protein